MKVKATKEGVYAGYNREEGEVFEIDDKPFELKDSDGKPILDADDNGKPKLGPGGKQKFKMGMWFSPEWMERVDDDTEITNDYPPFQIPIQYREAKKKTGQKSGKPSPSVNPLESSVI